MPLGDDVLTYSRVTGRANTLTRLQAGLLNACDAPRTLDEQARLCAEKFPRWSPEVIKGQLIALVEKGLLLPEQYLRDLCGRAPAPGAPPEGITHLGVVTCNRPEHLARCLSGYAANGQKHGRRPEYVVADDTGDAGARSDTRRMLRALGRRYGANITYLGLEEKRRLAARLVSDGGIPREVVDFALFDLEGRGVSIGANRNALLIYTAGRVGLSTDDDIFCDVAPNPSAVETPVVGDLARHNQFWFFPDRERALSAVEFTDLDVLALHERFLGAALAPYLSGQAGGPAPEIEELDASLFRGLASGTAAVRLTYSGTVGDSALRSPSRFLYLDGPARARFLESEAHYRSACQSREVLRAVTRPVITRNSWCMTGSFGFDHRTLLPPFFPVGRNEDGVYGETLRAVMKDACYAHLPCVQLHAPPEARTYVRGELSDGLPFLHGSHVVVACISAFDTPFRALGAAEGMRKLGAHLSTVGGLPPPDFEEFTRVHLLRLWASQAAQMERLLSRYGDSPGYWAEDARRHLDVLRKTLTRPDVIHPRDPAGGAGPEESLASVRRLMYDFGQLLCWWPSIFEAAKGMDMSAPAAAGNIRR